MGETPQGVSAQVASSDACLLRRLHRTASPRRAQAEGLPVVEDDDLHVRAAAQGNAHRNNQQSTVNSQQSTVNSQQSTVMTKRLFIVFEGIDSSGKTTQAELLKQYFLGMNQQAVISPEPSNGIIGNLIRQALKRRIIFSTQQDLFDEQMAYLFAADRHDHLYNEIDGVFKLIQDNYHVISTRYYFSSLAYNGNNIEQYNLIKKLNDRFPNPDLTIYLDIPIHVSLARLQERSSTEIYETEAKLTKVKEQYQKIFAQYDGRMMKIDGTNDAKQIHQQIVQAVNSTISI
ncbi:MAG: dTMP kinase [Cyanobacteria bacterium P01_A01_bin.83]